MPALLHAFEVDLIEKSSLVYFVTSDVEVATNIANIAEHSLRVSIKVNGRAIDMALIMSIVIEA